MAFNSLLYCIFLILVFLIHFYVKQEFRCSVLLLSSFIFYATLDSHILLVALIGVIVFSYFMGKAIMAARSATARRNLLIVGICSIVIVLATIKILPFFASGAQPFISIGISYFVFQAISYLIDVYYEFVAPEQHFGKFALYMSFFPKLLQGPIERADNFLPQLSQPYEIDYQKLRSGILLFGFGLFKKVVLADRLGSYVDVVYNEVHSFSGLTLLLATYIYAFQLYLDFSGYTDMAIGAARLFNINVTQNFNKPYLATSIADFWRRWHISFSSWILDYIFKPLQMRLRDWRQNGTVIALIVTFLISGLWHGIGWGFLIWGGLHGLYLATSVIFKPYQNKLHKKFNNSIILKWYRIAIVFNLVSFAWIFFRANSVADSFYIVTHMLQGVSGLSRWVFTYGKFNLGICAMNALAYLSLRYCIDNDSIKGYFDRHKYFRGLAYNVFALYIIFFGMHSSTDNFIYFRF